MGEKDFQQLYLVRKYLKKNHRSKIIGCKTIREKNKLALSSRNLRLSKTQLIKASKLIQNIMNIKKSLKKKITLIKFFIKKKELSKLYNIKIEYLEFRNIKNLKLSNKLKNSKIFLAYYLDKVRLIDNF